MRDSIVPLVALVATALAQTSTICDPLKLTCPADPALGTSFNTTWNGESSLDDDYWTPDASGGPSYPSNNTGAAFSVTGKGVAPTITTNFYMFWGHVEVLMKASAGQGIISSIVLLSDDLDEIDWEIMGGNTTHVETNYYGKGNATQMNAIYYPCDAPQADYHNYTINWNAEKVEWILDGKVLRTLAYDEAVDDDGTSMYPQTPMQLKIGSWAGGDPSNPKGTIEWAGGVTDYTKGPYTMLVQSAKAFDGTTNATKYEYGDHTGSWESIKVTKGKSDAAKKILAPPPLTPTQRWNRLPKGAQIAIIAATLSIVAILIVGYGFFCIRQRRAGKRERIQFDEKWAREQAELEEYKRRAYETHMAKKGPHVSVSALR